MARDKAYWEAEQSIKAARRKGAIELDLCGMQLTELPEAIASLTRLQGLYLHNNQLSELPEAIASLTQLQWLSLHNRPLAKVPNAWDKEVRVG